jgi:SAM-dependent methyltransferase
MKGLVMFAFIKQKRINYFIVFLYLTLTFDIYGKKSDKSLSDNIFDRIYKRGGWGDVGSGPGSVFDVNKKYIKYLHSFIKKHKIKSIVDIGCGDWQIFSHVNLKGVKYTGYDVAKSVIDKNIKKHQASNVSFVHVPLDKRVEYARADLMIVKDVLQHLSLKKTQEILDQLSKYKYSFVINDFLESTVNREIDDGGYRHLDIRKSPFFINKNLKQVQVVNSCCSWDPSNHKKLIIVTR